MYINIYVYIYICLRISEGLPSSEVLTGCYLGKKRDLLTWANILHIAFHWRTFIDSHKHTVRDSEAKDRSAEEAEKPVEFKTILGD